MIPVRPAPEPPSFDAQVRRRGERAIQRLLGVNLKGPGRKPKVTYANLEEIPTAKFPAYWTEARETDGGSTLDDMMALYSQQCAYLAMRIEYATGSPTVDHYLPKVTHRDQIYEWSNYRLSAACVNSAKGAREVIDPFKVQPGWFQLNLDTFFVQRGPTAPESEVARMDETLKILNLRPCVKQRREFVMLYREHEIDLSNIERYAPFIASELRRQGQLLP